MKKASRPIREIIDELTQERVGEPGTRRITGPEAR